MVANSRAICSTTRFHPATADCRSSYIAAHHGRAIAIFAAAIGLVVSWIA